MQNRRTQRGPIHRRAALAGLAASAAVAALPAWAEARRSLAGRTVLAGGPGGVFVGLQSHPQTLALEDGEVVLTLDDGPLAGPTERVLEALRLHEAHATFFLIGRNALHAPGIVRRMAHEGHSVGHHTMNHPWTLRQRSFETGVREIEDGIRAVQSAQGLAGPGIATPFFRFPGFADTPELNGWLSQHDMLVFGSDLWASDWTPMSPERQLSLLMQRLNRARKGIILLHDVIGQTAAMMPAFLAALHAGGYKVVSVKPGSARPALASAPQGWSSHTERMIRRRA